MKLLIVTAVRQERDAVRAGLADADHELLVCGVGPAAAAAATARRISEAAAAGITYDGVINAGIAGGFAGRIDIGATVVAEHSVSAELGVRLADRFQPIDELGFGSATADCHAELTAPVAGTRGDILTLATITGTGERAAELARTHPAALAESMEGFGVATAASAAGLRFAEVRTITNTVGDREVAGWDWSAGFAALTTAGAQLATVGATTTPKEPR